MKILCRCLSYIALACSLVATAIDPAVGVVIGIVAIFMLILGYPTPPPRSS